MGGYACIMPPTGSAVINWTMLECSSAMPSNSSSTGVGWHRQGDPLTRIRGRSRGITVDRAACFLMRFHRLWTMAETRLVTDHDDLWNWYEEHAVANVVVDRIEFSSPDSAGESEVVGTNFERKFIAEAGGSIDDSGEEELTGAPRGTNLVCSRRISL